MSKSVSHSREYVTNVHCLHKNSYILVGFKETIYDKSFFFFFLFLKLPVDAKCKWPWKLVRCFPSDVMFQKSTSRS